MTRPPCSRARAAAEVVPAGDAVNGGRARLRAFLLVVALVLLPAGGAAAAPTPGGRFVCEDGTRVTGQQIYTDVLVPAGATCHLTEVAVRGDLLVDPEAELEVRSSAVLGDVLTSGYAFFSRSTIEGDVWLDGWNASAPAGPTLDSHMSTITGSVGGRGGVTLFYGHVQGGVNVAVTSGAHVIGARVDGWMNLPVLGRAVVDILFSDLRSGLTFSERGRRSVCGTTVARDLVVRSVGGELHVGAAVLGNNRCYSGMHPPGHPLEGVDPPEGHAVSVGGDLRVVRAGAGVALDHVTVGGDLRCEEEVSVGLVEVAGARTGTCG